MPEALLTIIGTVNGNSIAMATNRCFRSVLGAATRTFLFQNPKFQFQKRSSSAARCATPGHAMAQPSCKFTQVASTRQLSDRNEDWLPSNALKFVRAKRCRLNAWHFYKTLLHAIFKLTVGSLNKDYGTARFLSSQVTQILRLSRSKLTSESSFNCFNFVARRSLRQWL